MEPELKESGLLADSAILFAGNGLGSVIGFAFHLAVARVGGPVVYADLGALISLNTIFSVAALSIQIYAAARVARLLAKGCSDNRYIGGLTRKILLAGLPACLLVVAASPWIARFLKQGTGGVAVVGAIILPLLGSSVMRGGLQGRQRFFALGGLRVLEPSVQFVIGVSLVALGIGATGAILGAFCAILTTLAVGWSLIRPSFAPAGPLPGETEGLNYFIRITLFLGLVIAMTNLDVLLVKHHFPHDSAAQYTAASLMSRFLLLSAVSIGFAMFPKTATKQGGAGRPLLIKSLKYYLAFAVPFVAVCSVFSNLIVRLLWGTQYLESASLLPRMLSAYAVFGIAYLVSTYRLSLDFRLVWLPYLVTVALEASLIGFFPAGVSTVAWYMVGCSVLLFLGSMLPIAALRSTSGGGKDE